MGLLSRHFSSSTPQPAGRLRKVLCQHQAEILREWTARVRELRVAPQLSDEAIIDHLPQILGQITQLLEPRASPPHSTVAELGETHAIDRLKQGFELDQVVMEYRLLWRTIMDVWGRTIGSDISLAELRALHEAFDESIVQAVVQYAGSRERVLKGLNQVSEAAARSPDLDAFLRAMLSATVETLSCVDTAVVLVREGDRLRVRASIGLEDELPKDFSIAVGEGFAGRIAQLAEPLCIADAANDPIVTSSIARVKQIRALYGVPLLAQGEVIGVAHIGSLTGTEFSEENKLLFRTMASRAASYIAKARLQSRLQETARDNRRLYEEAKDAVATRDQFLAVVSHDLRNQLGIVSNVSSTLQNAIERGDQGSVSTLVGALQRSSAMMKRLVDDLLDSAAIRAGALSVALAPVGVDWLLQQAVDAHAAQASAAGIDLRIVRTAGGSRVLCDSQRILQVFSNLIGNAIRHCADGASICVAAEREAGEVLFTVSDTGNGVPPELVSHLFNPFRAGHNTNGTGLGLYISRGIVERHGGRIWHEAGPGKGAIFRFKLPAA